MEQTKAHQYNRYTMSSLGNLVRAHEANLPVVLKGSSSDWFSRPCKLRTSMKYVAKKNMPLVNETGTYGTVSSSDVTIPGLMTYDIEACSSNMADFKAQTT